MSRPDELEIPTTDLGAIMGKKRVKPPVAVEPELPLAPPVRARADLKPDQAALMMELDRLHREATGADMSFVLEDRHFEQVAEAAAQAINPENSDWKKSFQPKDMPYEDKVSIHLALGRMRLEEIGPDAPYGASITVQPEAPEAPEGIVDHAAVNAGSPEAPVIPQVTASEAEEDPVDPFESGTAAAVTAIAVGAAPATVVPGIPPGTPTYIEAPEVSKAAIDTSLVMGTYGTIQSGDAPEENAPLAKEPHEVLLTRLGIPPRPRAWPVMMQWPPARDLALLDRPEVAAADRRKYVEGLFLKQQMMLERARRIDAYIRENDPDALAADVGLLNRRSKHYQRHDKKVGDEPYYGIAWAQLLDQKSTDNVANIVGAWSHTSARTLDGGIVKVGAEGISFGRYAGKVGCPTEQSIQLALREGVARGWKTFKVKGSTEFAMLVEKHARSMNIQCEIQVYDGWFDYRNKKIFVMPAPPVDPKAPKPTPENAPESAPESAGQVPAADDRAAASPGEGGAAKAPKPGAKRKRPLAEDAIDDEPEIGAYQP